MSIITGKSKDELLEECYLKMEEELIEDANYYCRIILKALLDEELEEDLTCLYDAKELLARCIREGIDIPAFIRENIQAISNNVVDSNFGIKLKMWVLDIRYKDIVRQLPTAIVQSWTGTKEAFVREFSSLVRRAR